MECIAQFELLHILKTYIPHILIRRELESDF